MTSRGNQLSHITNSEACALSHFVDAGTFYFDMQLIKNEINKVTSKQLLVVPCFNYLTYFHLKRDVGAGYIAWGGDSDVADRSVTNPSKLKADVKQQ